jgi:hypothetical protein
MTETEMMTNLKNNYQPLFVLHALLQWQCFMCVGMICVRQPHTLAIT